MAPRPTKTGTKRLSEVARKLVAPDGIVSTGWPAVRDTCRDKLGITFDSWQDGAGRLILAKRADGKLACMIGGVGMSLPRQVGKTYLIAALIFALCILRPGLLVIWSAHHGKTHAETFLAIQAFAKRVKVAPYIRVVYTGSGDEEVRFHNGSRILFGARERGFGRGIPGVDVIVSDEAQIMSDKALDAQLATMNTSSLGLAIFIGTPPRPDDPSEAFTRMRTEAWSGTLRDAVWIELGADPEADIHDRRQWAKANPSYPHRTPAESIMRLQRKLKPDSFLREALGVWDDMTGAAAFGSGNWDACRNEGRPKGAKVGGLAIAVSYDQSFATISAGGRHVGVVHVKPIEHRPGTSWVVERAALLQSAFGVKVAIDRRGPGAFLIPDLEAAGVDLFVMDTEDVLDACAWIHSAVAGEMKTLGHAGYKELDESVAGAVKRTVGDRWAWGRKTSKANTAPLESVTFAGFLASQRPDVKAPPAKPAMQEGRSQVADDNVMTIQF